MSRVCLALVLALASLFTGDAWAGPRFAVLVGVGSYDPASSIQGGGNASGPSGIDLKSPPNDVALMGEILARYGFDTSNTRMLKNGDATRERIISSVETNLLTLPAGALAVFYFSGHGSALQGKDGGGEWIDETIVPYDGRISGKAPRDIVDDEIYGWIETLNRRGVATVFIFDSCFSGGIARLGGAEIKSLPAATVADRNHDGQRTLRKGVLPGRSSLVVVLTASEANEPAQGALVKDRFQGVFTTALRSVLAANDANAIPPVRWGDAINRVTSSLKIPGSDTPLQSPHVFGNRDAKIFDSDAPYSNAVDARRISDTRAVIAAGADLGVTEGSIYKLFGPEEIPWRKSDRFEARVRVVATRAADSDVETIGEAKLRSETLAAVETEYAVPKAKIKIRLPDEGSVDPFDRRAILNGVARFAEIGDRDAELVLSFADKRWALTTIGEKQVGAAIAAGNTDVLSDEITQRVAGYIRWKRLADWKRQGEIQTPMRYRAQSQSADNPSSFADVVDSKVDARSKLRIIVENLSGRTVRADALLLRPNFTIDVCPIGTLEPKQELATETVELGQADGAAAWKIVLSDPAQQLSLLFLNSESGARSTATTANDEFARVWNGVEARDRGAKENEAFWQTFDVPFHVLPGQFASDASPPKRCLGLPQK